MEDQRRVARAPAAPDVEAPAVWQLNVITIGHALILPASERAGSAPDEMLVLGSSTGLRGRRSAGTL
jgi:hypothetical protein